jgi:MYXO-CTERM domain-containing protein
VGDLTNEGAQTNFVFAQITVPHNTKGTFTGRISIAGTQPGTIFDQPFSFNIPEPASALMAAFGLLGAVALRRRAA